MGPILISTNSKMQLPPEPLERDTHREAPQHYNTDLYKDLGQTYRQQAAPPVSPVTSSNTGDHSDTEGVQTANTGWGIRTLAGGSDLQLQPWGHCSGTYRWAPRLGSPDGF